MKHQEITYKIKGCIFEVYKTLGAGFLEKVYEQALLIELKDKGLKAEGQKPITITYKDNLVGNYIADIIVEDKIILELKAVKELTKQHQAQILNYLKATGIEIGLLVNFQHPKAEVKRLIKTK